MLNARGVLPEKLDRGVRPASKDPYPIYDQNLGFSLPYLLPDQKLDTLFMTCEAKKLTTEIKALGIWCQVIPGK